MQAGADEAAKKENGHHCLPPFPIPEPRAQSEYHDPFHYPETARLSIESHVLFSSYKIFE